MTTSDSNNPAPRGLPPGTIGAADAPGEDRESAAPTDPRVVTRGQLEKPEGEVGWGTAIIDWLGFTVKEPPGDKLGWLYDELQATFGVAPNRLTPSKNGWFGYKHRVDIAGFGLIAYGGESQLGTMHVEITGQGCFLVKDWAAVAAWGERVGATITRVDLAHDDLMGETVSIETAMEWYEAGLFSTCGRKPGTRVAGDWLGKEKGRTLYIGSRASGKMVRIYEKGKQLGGDGTTLLSKWTRIELELRNKDRVIPWEILVKISSYLAGAYPAFEYLSVEQDRVKTLRAAGQVTYDAMVRHLRTAGGKAINVMTQVEQGDVAAVVAQLIKPGGVPKRFAGFPDDVLAHIKKSQP